MLVTVNGEGILSYYVEKIINSKFPIASKYSIYCGSGKHRLGFIR